MQVQERRFGCGYGCGRATNWTYHQDLEALNATLREELDVARTAHAESEDRVNQVMNEAEALEDELTRLKPRPGS